MKIVGLSSWEDFVRKIAELRRQYDGRETLLFRGQANSAWPLQTTLERSIERAVSFLEFYDLILAAHPLIESFTDRAWHIENAEEIARLADSYDDLSKTLQYGRFRAYNFFVFLRHHGFPSPLLDWTRSPYVATFFAFRSAVKMVAESVSVFAYCERPNRGKVWSAGEPRIFRQGPYIRADRRHHRQQSEYTMCMQLQDANQWVFADHASVFENNAHDQDLLWRFDLPSSLRGEILRSLDEHNVNAYSLFDSTEAMMETLWVRESQRRLTKSGRGVGT